ncbi:MAG: sensor histidine kinase [Gaiellales bacterium]
MSWYWPDTRRHGADLLIGLAALACALEVALTRDSHSPLGFAVPAVIAMVLVLLGRHRFPFAAPAAMWILAAAASFASGQLVPRTNALFVNGFAAAFMLGQLRDTERGRIGLAVVLIGAAVIVYNDPQKSPGELVFTPLIFAVGWLIGFGFREREAQTDAAEARARDAEREREIAARVAVAEERARIARELHDIVAHAVSVMVLQVGAVRHKLPAEYEQNREALQDVEQTGRAALAEMRRLLDAMRGEQDELELTPRPGLGALEPLLDDVRRAGLPVQLEVEGEPVPLPEAVDLSAYRIIQEGLTNALKHAHASRADVIVRYAVDELQIDVRDDGRGPSTSDGLGHGLVGIRERVKLYGGQMTAGAVNGRGFVLSTRLPLRGALR